MTEVVLTLGIVVFLVRRTDFVFWYARFFGIVSGVYLTERKKGTNYLDWLNSKHDNFFTELLTCPFCMATWLAIGVMVIFGLESGPWAWLGIVGVYSALAFLKAALTKWT